MIYVHNHSIIHRDLKPLNILLSKPNDLSGLKIIDFGVAGTNLGLHSLDESKSGTMRYMAPEILSGKDFKS
jgi:serine/threonine protein kinase